ncbi:MAG: hypothetical protein H6687_01460 [Bacillales bacterium]|nr:hypothetical protein [Bacillales bacterium]
MKKIVFFLGILFIALFLSSCRQASSIEKERWYSDSYLESLNLDDFPIYALEDSFYDTDFDNFYALSTFEDYTVYVVNIYNYIIEKEYEYAGTRGDEKHSFAPFGFYSYYLLEEESVDNFDIARDNSIYSDYAFIFGNEVDSEGLIEDAVVIDIIFYELKQSREEKSNIYEYNVVLMIRGSSYKGEYYIK